MLASVASAFGLPHDVMKDPARMTRAQAEAQLDSYRRHYKTMVEAWDRATMQSIVSNAVFFVGIMTPREHLRLWRWEVGKTITMRQFRRLRGRVKAGQRIPEPPALWIAFDQPMRPRRRLAPFISPLPVTRPHDPRKLTLESFRNMDIGRYRKD